MPIMYPGTAFTGYSGTAYSASTGPIEVSTADMNLAFVNGWNPASVLSSPGSQDLAGFVATDYTPLKSAVPFIIPGTGSMANNGVITITNTLPATYANCYLYLPAGAIVAGSLAGWYFTQMSSGTAGTVYNNVYKTGVPTIPATGNPFVTTGPGAYTGVTTAVPGPNVTLAAGALGPNGQLQYVASWTMKGTTNNKTVSFLLGATTVMTLVEATATVLSFTSNVYVQNQGIAAAQVCTSSLPGSPFGTSTALNNYTTVNTALAQLVGTQMTMATATEYLIQDFVSINLMLP